MNYTWTKKELALLKEYDSLINGLAIIHPEERSEERIIQSLVLEGKLLMLNKYVGGYIDFKPIGIYTFNEALKNVAYFNTKGKLFDFHPVNFKNQFQFVDFLNG
jgi:hypothetical protein